MIRVVVNDYCQNCSDFKAHVTSEEVSRIVTTTIQCENRYKCDNIYENIYNYLSSQKDI